AHRSRPKKASELDCAGRVEPVVAIAKRAWQRAHAIALDFELPETFAPAVRRAARSEQMRAVRRSVMETVMDVAVQHGAARDGRAEREQLVRVLEAMRKAVRAAIRPPQRVMRRNQQRAAPKPRIGQYRPQGVQLDRRDTTARAPQLRIGPRAVD